MITPEGQNDKDLEASFRDAANIRLTPEERSSLRRAILAFAASHPVRARDKERQERQGSPYLIFTLIARPMPIALAGLLIVFTGGVSLAAEGALPGELLYPVKVSVNEELRAALTVSSDAKIAWEARRAERRLEEAETLASRGDFPAEARAVVEANFEAHADRIRGRIEEFEARGEVHAAAELSSNFEASLRAHERILDKLTEVRAAAGADIEALRAKVKSKGDAAAEARQTAEARISGRAAASVHAEEVQPTQSQAPSPTSRAAAERRFEAAEAKLWEVRALLSRLRQEFGADIATRAEARLADAEKLLAEARAKLKAGAADESFILSQRAAREVQEAKLFLRARQVLSIDVNGNDGMSVEPEDDSDEFDESVDDEGDGDDGASADVHTSFMQRIETGRGELTLRYEDGAVTLKGVLGRPNPCVNWRVGVKTNGDPASEIEFAVEDENAGAICIQILGTPQSVSASARAAPNTRYRVRLAGETVFEGAIVRD